MEAFLTSEAVAATTSLVLEVGLALAAWPKPDPGGACHAPATVDQVVVPVADGATGGQVGVVDLAIATGAQAGDADGPVGARRLATTTRARAEGPNPAYRTHEACGARVEPRLRSVVGELAQEPRP